MNKELSRRWRVLERDSFTCQYCGRAAPDVRLEIDHIVPRSAGGRDDDGNLITACWDCNRGKSDRDSLDGLVGQDWIRSLRKDVAILETVLARLGVSHEDILGALVDGEIEPDAPKIRVLVGGKTA